MLAYVCISNRVLCLLLHWHSARLEAKHFTILFLFWAIKFQWNPIYIPFKGFIKSILILEDCSQKLATSASTTSRYKAIFFSNSILFLKGKGKYFIFSLDVINRLKAEQTFSWQISRLEGTHHQNGQGLNALFWAVAKRWHCSGLVTVWSFTSSAPFSSISAMQGKTTLCSTSPELPGAHLDILGWQTLKLPNTQLLCSL